MPDFDTMFKHWTQEEVQAILDHHMGLGDGEDEIEVGSADSGGTELDAKLADLMADDDD